MKKLLLLIISIFIIASCVKGQGDSNNWYFGSNAGVTFTTGSPVALTNGALSTTEGCASISDAAGNLLFYTNGITIWNQNHLTMLNGTGLLGNTSSTQSAIIVQQPNNNNLFYVFTVAGASSLCYSIVDMTLNGGLGAVTAVKNVALCSPVTEKVTAIKHCNNNDVWVITHLSSSNAFYAYLVTNTGLNTTPIISNVGTVHTGGSNDIGYMKASPDGMRIGLAVRYQQLVELLDFDNNTGVVSNPITLSTSINHSYGIEFSPDGTKLYATNGLSSANQIWQWDVSSGVAATMIASQYLVGTPSTGCMAAIQMGPDSLLYFGNYGYDYMGCIANPNAAGVACGYNVNAVSLAGRNCQLGLPTFVQRYLFQPANFVYSTLSVDTCFGDNTHFFVTDSMSFTSFYWNFDDPSSGASNTSTLPSPYHTFTAPGTYDVMLVVTYGCGTDTVLKTVTIIDVNLTATATPTTICTGDSVTLDVTGTPTGNTYTWNNGLGVGNTHLVTPITNTTYIVTASNGGCFASDTVTVVVDSVINPTIIPLNPNICVGDSVSLTVSGGNNYLWDNGLTQSTITVSPAITTTYSVTATSISGCSGTASVDVTVNPAVNLNLSATNLQLCIGDSSLLIASSTDPGTTYLWSGGLGTNDSIILFPTNTNTYIVTATSSGGCVEIDSLTIQVDSNITVTINPTTAEICKGESVNILASGGNNYLWNNGATQANITVNPTSTTNYSVTATSTAGCSGSATMTVTVHPGPIAVYFISPSPAGVNQTVQFTDASIGASSWDWDFGDGQTAIGLDPTHSYTTPGSYDTWLNVEDNHGCKDSTSVRIVINQLFTFYIPNSFSPDDNGVNDIFIPSGVNVDEDRYIMQIYDRWGSLIFESKDITKGWDGSINGQEIISEETFSNVFSYYFHIYERYTDIDHEYRGHLIIVK
jgi:gliding motility-associated-like protein